MGHVCAKNCTAPALLRVAQILIWTTQSCCTPPQQKKRIWFHSYKQITRISKRVTHEDNVTRTWFQNARQPARSQSFLIQPTAFSRCNTQTHRPLHPRGGACICPPVVPVAIHCESTPAASLLQVFCFSLGESIPHIQLLTSSQVTK